MTSQSGRQSLNALPPGTVLHDYVIESELGSGGFSMVYLARHRLNSDWLFAIKEFLPGELVVRDNDGASVHPVNMEAEEAFEDGLRRFRDEAEQLRRFRNERYVVSCLNYFEANGTAYLVMDYDDGLPLSEFLRQREEAGQPFTEKDLRAVVEPLLEGLTVVHRAGVLHRDIKPGNIFVRRPDDITGRPAQPVLIDFGAAKQNYLTRHSRSQAPYTPGYAAYEQISSEGDIGPWTDIYAVGALMWRMVAGGCPGDERLFVTEGSEGTGGTGVWSPTPRAAEKRAYALHRGQPDPMVPAAELGADRFSPKVLKAIDRCLALYPEDRVQDCVTLGALLESASTSMTAATQAQAQGRASKAWNTKAKATKRSRSTVVARVGTALASAVLRGHLPKYCGFAIAATLAGAGLFIVWITRTSTWAVGSALAILLMTGYYSVLREPASPTVRPASATGGSGGASPVVVQEPTSTPTDRNLDSTTEEVTPSPVSVDTSADGPISSGAAVEASETGEPLIVGGSAILVVETVPAGARVSIAGEDLGVTPLELSGLRAGRYEITLDHPAYEVLRLSEQRLTDGEVLRIERILTLATGRLTVLTEPSEAWVEFDGRRLAEETPITLPNLPAGTVELTLGAMEHRTVQVRLDIPRNGLAILEQTLEPVPYGTLTLQLTPSDATVTLLDIVPSYPSYRPGMRLPEGEYRVEVHRSGYEDASRIVRVAGDTVERIELNSLGAGMRFRDCPDCPEMVVIPAGSFMMGSPPDERQRLRNEGPLRRVTISDRFALGRTEVTFAQWEACVSDGGCGLWLMDDVGWGRGNRPVIAVSWWDAQAYVAWLSLKTGEEYRLPSEAEWEYAARAGTTTRYSWGDEIGRNRANCDGCGSRWDGTRTSPVGSFPANAFSLHDMHGNVWEWVEDCWNDAYNGAPNGGSAWLQGDCARRVMRGSSWFNWTRQLRSAHRFGNSAVVRTNVYGFRVVRTLTP